MANFATIFIMVIVTAFAAFTGYFIITSENEEAQKKEAAKKARKKSPIILPNSRS